MHSSTFIYCHGQCSQSKPVAGKHTEMWVVTVKAILVTHKRRRLELSLAQRRLTALLSSTEEHKAEGPAPDPQLGKREVKDLLSSKLWCLNFLKGFWMAVLRSQASSGREEGVLNMKVY